MLICGLPAPVDPTAATRRHIVDVPHSYPCRRCLRDAEVGEAVLLLSYDPWRLDSVYRQSGPVFLHERDCEPWQGTGVPEQQRRRLLSLRGFDSHGLATVAEVVPGAQVQERLAAVLDDGRTEFVHLHNAGPGCFAARVDRDPRTPAA